MTERLALFGGNPVRTRPFPGYPVIDEDDKKAVMAVLDRGALSTFGAGPKGNFAGGVEVRRFEENFAAYNGSRYALSVNSATAGLHAALAALGIGPGDEVIVPPYTFTATATSVLMHNAIPVFCDIEDRSYTLDPKKLKACISSKTRAIIPVHLFGHPADMEYILAVAEETGLSVIEDCAQAPGAVFNNVKVGNLGHLGVFSFQETKNLPIGEGGMVTTNDEFLAERVKMIRNHGESILLGKPREYISNIIGWNYRMTEMEAALGNSQLGKLPGQQKIRAELFEYLREELNGLPGLTVPYIAQNVIHGYHIFALKYDASLAAVSRERVIEALAAEGLPAAPGYRRALYDNPIFQEKLAYGKQGCPFTCGFYGREIDYTKIQCPVSEKLIHEKAIWIFTARPPATIKDMRDYVIGFRKIWANRDSLRDL